MPGTSRRLNYQSDLGTESNFWPEDESASVSSIRYKSVCKHSTLAEVTYNFCCAGTTRRSSKLPPGLGTEKIPEMPNKYQMAVSELGICLSIIVLPPHLTLLPPSPSISMSSLSAIPEEPASVLRPEIRRLGSRRTLSFMRILIAPPHR